MAVAHYFRKALEATEHNIIMVGPFSGVEIPWMGGMELPEKYVVAPLIQTPWQEQSYLIRDVEDDARLPRIDLWFQADSTFFLAGKPHQGVNAIIAVDPHVLNYDRQRRFADFFFNMQSIYCEPGDIWLPYAYSVYDHYPVEAEIEYDVMLIGLQYANRCAVMGALAEKGYRTYLETGPVFEEARELYAKTKVILNWSSLLDTVARVWEAMAFRKCLVTNRTPGLGPMFKEGEHYLGFGTIGEALEKIEWALAHDEERERIARAGWQEVTAKGHSYDDRVDFILGRVG